MTVRAPRPITRRLVTTGPAVAVALATLGCSATTIESSATTIPPDEVVPTTVFAPSGTTHDLLTQLAGETALLSERLVEGTGQHEAMARIEALWALIRPAVDTERPELIGAFDTVIDLVRSSVERRRPADADKADKNLAVLIVAYER